MFSLAIALLAAPLAASAQSVFNNTVCASALESLDFYGGDLANGAVQASDLPECCLACQKTPACIGYTFVSFEQTCYMKAVIREVVYRYSGETTSGLVVPTTDLGVRPNPPPQWPSQQIEQK